MTPYPLLSSGSAPVPTPGPARAVPSAQNTLPARPPLASPPCRGPGAFSPALPASQPRYSRRHPVTVSPTRLSATFCPSFQTELILFHEFRVALGFFPFTATESLRTAATHHVASDLEEALGVPGLRAVPLAVWPKSHSQCLAVLLSRGMGEETRDLRIGHRGGWSSTFSAIRLSGRTQPSFRHFQNSGRTLL